MKTAISLPDDLFEAADRLASQLGHSRSELYANAVAEFIERHKQQGVTERLDAVYGDRSEDSQVDPVLATAQLRTVRPEDW